MHNPFDKFSYIVIILFDDKIIPQFDVMMYLMYLFDTA